MTPTNGLVTMTIIILAAVCMPSPETAQAQTPATETYSIGIKGMTCETCATQAHKALASISGVTKASVDYKVGHAWVVVNKPLPQSGVVRPRHIFVELASAISSAGYKPTVNYVLTIKGMTCEDCSKHIVDALKNVPGVVSSSVNYKGGYAIVVPSVSSPPDPNRIIGAVQKAGYTSRIHSGPIKNNDD